MLLNKRHVGLIVLTLAWGLSPASADDTFLTGGPGGGGFRDQCGAGQFLAGVSVRSGDWLDSVTPYCAPFNANSGQIGAPGFPMDRHGGSGGGSHGPITCGTDQYVQGMLFGFTDDDSGNPQYIASVELICASIRGGRGGSPRLGANGNFKHGGADCPEGQAGVGLVGRSGDFVDALGLICAPRPVATGNADASQQPAGPQPKPDAILNQRAAGGSLAEPNFDRPGQDYTSFDLDAANANLCEGACRNDGRCKAWTYVQPGVQGPKARCWLKSGVPPSISNSCCISGLKAGICDAGSHWDNSAQECRSVQ